MDISDPAQVDMSGPLQFIDFEYSAPGYRGFDWGNHFNEYAGIVGRVQRLALGQSYCSLRLVGTLRSRAKHIAAINGLRPSVLLASAVAHLIWAGYLPVCVLRRL